jgi:prepilin-type N-terminal cleavage/methylation domain-containing protein
MKEVSNISAGPHGFSLAEVLAALVIGTMVLVAVLGIYGRAETSAAAIVHKLEASRLPSEVLQRIAEDIDRIITPGANVKVTIENKFEKGYPTARLTILKTIYDGKEQKQTFERIIWQGSYDYDSGTGGLVLYRSYNGINSEDKLLDVRRKDWEAAYPFVPICTGLTCFKAQVRVGEDLQDAWTNDSLPKEIVVTISFAEPLETVEGTLEVPDEEKIIRNIAVDRTRKIRFIFVKKEDEEKQD